MTPAARSALIGLVAGLAGLLGPATARGETLITVPAGTYDVSEVVTRAGTAAAWVRYRPATAGTVVLRGGGSIDLGFVILDGFFVDGNLDPDLNDPTRTTPRANGLFVSASNVLVENTEIVGVNDVHNGYDTSNQTSCVEFDFGISGNGLRVSGSNVTMRNITLHGFREASTVNQTGSLTIENSLYRNNFNGVTMLGLSLVIRDSVFWDHPNHQFSINTAESGSLFDLENNLLSNSQDMIKAGGNWIGVARFIVRHNTFFLPANDPCGEYAGINSDNVRQQSVIRDNLFVNLRNGLIISNSDLLPTLDSDYNFIYQYDPIAPPDEFRWETCAPGACVSGAASQKTSLEAWQNTTCSAGRCLDQNTIVRQAPVFADAPAYVVNLPSPGNAQNQWGWRTPTSAAEARSWLTLMPGSPGKGAASDGMDMGFVSTSLPGTVCGDGVLDVGELCDPGPPEQLDGNDCTTVPGGFASGLLHCNSTCSNWDVNACVAGGGDTTPPSTPANLRRTDRIP
ncbi:MAG: hypothetical protein ACE5IK_07305 [Acidobacteriota bacterium]